MVKICMWTCHLRLYKVYYYSMILQYSHQRSVTTFLKARTNKCTINMMFRVPREHLSIFLRPPWSPQNVQCSCNKARTHVVDFAQNTLYSKIVIFIFLTFWEWQLPVMFHGCSDWFIGFYENKILRSLTLNKGFFSERIRTYFNSISYMQKQEL